MGLVQADGEKGGDSQSVDLNGLSVIWDQSIEELTAMYGQIKIDFVQNYYGARLVVGFDGISC